MQSCIRRYSRYCHVCHVFTLFIVLCSPYTDSTFVNEDFCPEYTWAALRTDLSCLFHPRLGSHHRQNSRTLQTDLSPALFGAVLGINTHQVSHCSLKTSASYRVRQRNQGTVPLSHLELFDELTKFLEVVIVNRGESEAVKLFT